MSLLPRARLCLSHAVLGLLLTALPSSALGAVSSTVSAGVLTVNLSAADDVTVTCVGGQTRVNGAVPSPGPAATCASLIRVRVIATGSFANTIDLTGVERALGFSGLQQSGNSPSYDVSQTILEGIAIAVDAGGGDDDYLGSDDPLLAESVVPGDGSDAVAAGFGGLGFILFDAPAPEVDTLEVVSVETLLGALPVTTPIDIDLNGGVGGDPAAILSHLNRVVKRAATSTEAITTVYGGESDDVIVGNAGGFTRFGFSGGADTYLGGPAADTYTFEAALGTGAVTIDDPTGENELNFFNAGEPMTVDLTGGLGGGVLARSASNDIVVMGDAATAAAIRTVRGSESSDDVTGNDQDNVFLDCFGNDVYRGGPGNDTFSEYYGFVRAPGGTAFVDCGNDRYEGGPGDDKYQIACRAAAGLETKTVVELPAEGTDEIEHRQASCVAGMSLVLDLRSDSALASVAPTGGGPPRQLVQTGAPGQAANFENASGGANGAMIFGNSANNRLTAGALTTLVFGGPGDDSFSSGTVSYANAPGPVVVDLRAGNATGEGNDTFETNVLRVVGSPFDDVMRARSGATMILSGGEGHDVMHGQFQNTLNGDGGNDLLTLVGGTANGGAGNDTLLGVGFASVLNGNEGDDTFLLSGGLHAVNGGAGADTIDARNEREDDQISCGTEIDVARADPGDTVNADCESVNPGPPPSAPDPTGLALVSCGETEQLAFLASASDAGHVFFSTDEPLLPADTDSAIDIYERTPAGLRLVSGGSAAIAPTFDAISDDGTRVFFDTNEALPDTGDTDTAFDVYERSNGVLRLVSGGNANKNAFFGGATPNGDRVWFTSEDALLPADTDAAFDVYERQGNALTLISGPAVTGTAFFADAMADGSRVWFDATKSLLPVDTDGASDVYERSGGMLTLISDVTFPGTTASFNFRAASADGSRVYFDGFVGLSTPAGLYEHGPGGTTSIGAGTFRAVSSDGARIVLETRERLLPADVDQAVDLYRSEGGLLTLLSGGIEEIDVGFRAASADATRIIFETTEPLLVADTDVALDIYENDAGTLALLSSGTADAHAVFRSAAADATRIFFRTGEALVAEDTDNGLDVYEASDGIVTLRSAGTGHVTSFFGGTADDGDVVFVVSDEGLVAGDTDGQRDLYALGPAGFSVDPICTEIRVGEVCDNCLDDDEDGAIDRADDECAPPADGAGVGLGDPKLKGKAALKCQKALGKAGAKLARQKLKRLQKCLQTAFVCIQQKPGDVACEEKAAEICATFLDGIAQDRVKAAESVTKACAVPRLDPEDLRAAEGLGFEAEEPICAGFDIASLDDASAIATCLLRTHECRAEAAAGVEVPRASELLRFAGRDPESELPCLGAGTDGEGQALGDPKTVGKAAAKCQGGMAKAGAKLLAQKLRTVQTCTGLVATCIQQKSGDPACLSKATASCTTLLDELEAPETGAEAKHGAAIHKACGVPAVDIGGLVASAGLGFGTHAATCAALGVPTLATVDDVVSCTTALHECRAAQLLETQIPRVHELLEIVGAELP